MTTVVTQPMDGWKAINRKQIRHNVFKLQKRIYQASIGTTDNCRMIEEPCEVETLKHGFAAERRERSRRLGINSAMNQELPLKTQQETKLSLWRQ
jgi:hypothetical protein